MNSASSHCGHAIQNLAKILNITRVFPDGVFAEGWTNFLFFDSDWMFHRAFVMTVQSLLEIEGAECACMVNLERLSRRNEFCIDRATRPEAYQSVLSGPELGEGWLFEMDRFGCASELCEWCIYAERANEMAVIGFAPGIQVARFMTTLGGLHASRIESALDPPLSSGFMNLPAEWRAGLVRHYARRGDD